jgi:hypothetical protein
MHQTSTQIPHPSHGGWKALCDVLVLLPLAEGEVKAQRRQKIYSKSHSILIMG